MNKTAVTWILSLCFFTGLFSAESRSEYGGGGGLTQEDPFLISEPAHLLAIGSNPSHWNKFFRLTNNLNMSGYTWTPSNFIGINFGSSFTGTFDGDGHTISNLSFTAATGNVVGLFGLIDTGTVKDLGLVNVAIEVTTAVNIGGLVGVVAGGHIENCYTIYTISTGNSAQFVGGLAGQASVSIISGSYSQGDSCEPPSNCIPPAATGPPTAPVC